MLRPNPYRTYPKIDKSATIDPSAIIIGDVKIGKNVFVGPGAVIRADEQKSSIVINNNCNVQDNVTIHALSATRVVIGRNSSLSHGSIVHGPAQIGEGCFIGFGSIVFKAVLGPGVFIQHRAVVEGLRIPAKTLIPNGAVIDTKNNLKSLKKTPRQLSGFAKKVTKTNLFLARAYKKIYKRSFP